MKLRRLLIGILFVSVCGCKHKTPNKVAKAHTAKTSDSLNLIISPPEHSKVPEGMVWIPGGKFIQGTVLGDTRAKSTEKPAHPVAVDGFYMDKTEVTNAQFAKFVKETGYVTVAERKIDWNELKKQLPPGTPKPADSILRPGSLIFKKTKTSVPNLFDYSQWWEWKIGANWKHPYGPKSSIEGKGNYPVVQIAYEDALAYCEWKGTRLPTEAEWEYAARGGLKSAKYPWGNNTNELTTHANTWEGEFPTNNTKEDGFEGVAPIKSYPPNNFGLYDMAGNVWEWTKDWYNINYYNQLQEEGLVKNPQGAKQAYNPPSEAAEKVIKGGSYLCNASYCSSYRISARMMSTPDSAHEHVGFRTVLRVEAFNK